MMNTEDLQKAEFLTKEQITKMAPSVYAMQPSNDVSDKYTHIPTEPNRFWLACI